MHPSAISDDLVHLRCPILIEAKHGPELFLGLAASVTLRT